MPQAAPGGLARPLLIYRRNAEPALAELVLSNEQVALSARRLARAREALEAATHDLARRAELNLHEGAYASLDRAVFAQGSEELRVRLMMLLLGRFGGQPEQPSLARVEELCDRLQTRPSDTSTLAGCFVSAAEGTIEIYREMGREGLPEIALSAGEHKVWDCRFGVSFQGSREIGEVSVGALGEDGWRDVRAGLELAIRLPHRAVITLPAFRAGRDIVSVPQLDFHELNYGRKLCAATFIWSLAPPGWPKT